MTWWGWCLLGLALGVGLDELVRWQLRRALAGDDAAPEPIPTPAQVEQEKQAVAGIAREAAADPDPEKTLEDLMKPR